MEDLSPKEIVGSIRFEGITSIIAEAVEDFGAGKALEHSLKLGARIADGLIRGVEGAERLVASAIEQVEGFTKALPEELAPLGEGIQEALHVLRIGLESGGEWLKENKEVVDAACQLLIVAKIAYENPAGLATHLLNDPRIQAKLIDLVGKVVNP